MMWGQPRLGRYKQSPERCPNTYRRALPAKSCNVRSALNMKAEGLALLGACTAPASKTWSSRAAAVRITAMLVVAIIANILPLLRLKCLFRLAMTSSRCACRAFVWSHLLRALFSKLPYNQPAVGWCFASLKQSDLTNHSPCAGVLPSDTPLAGPAWSRRLSSVLSAVYTVVHVPVDMLEARMCLPDPAKAARHRTATC